MNEEARRSWIRLFGLDPDTPEQELKAIMNELFGRLIRQRQELNGIIKKRAVGTPHVHGTFGKEGDEMKRVSEKMRKQDRGQDRHGNRLVPQTTRVTIRADPAHERAMKKR